MAFVGHRSDFRSTVGRFYSTYLIAGLVPLVPGAVIFFAPLWGWRPFGPAVLPAVGAIVIVLSYLAAWPYVAARIQRIVWERPTLGPFSFKTTIAFRTLLPLALKNFALLVMTAGLYWPFASIAWARYRIGCMSIVVCRVCSTLPWRRSTRAPRSTPSAKALRTSSAIDIGW